MRFVFPSWGLVFAYPFFFSPVFRLSLWVACLLGCCLVSDRFFFLLFPWQNFVSIWFPLIFVICAHTFMDLRSLGRLCWHISWVPRGGTDEPYSSISRGFHSIFHGGLASLNLLAESLQSHLVVFRVFRLSFPCGISDLDVVHVGSYVMGSRGFSPRSFLAFRFFVFGAGDYGGAHFTDASGTSLVYHMPYPSVLHACRLPPGSVLCLWPGTTSPSSPFPCFIACNSSV